MNASASGANASQRKFRMPPLSLRKTAEADGNATAQDNFNLALLAGTQAPGSAGLDGVTVLDDLDQERIVVGIGGPPRFAELVRHALEELLA
jgi:hypothetical protein